MRNALSGKEPKKSAIMHLLLWLKAPEDSIRSNALSSIRRQLSGGSIPFSKPSAIGGEISRVSNINEAEAVLLPGLRSIELFGCVAQTVRLWLPGAVYC